MCSGFFRGTSVDQDSRFGDKEQKYLKEMKFPACYAKKVNIKNVSMVYIKKWIAERLKKMLDVEDEILFNYVVSQLEEEPLDPRHVQVNLTGFLGDGAAHFMAALWNVLTAAQENGGVPHEAIEAEKRRLERERLQPKITKKTPAENIRAALERASTESAAHRQEEEQQATSRDGKRERRSEHRGRSSSTSSERSSSRSHSHSRDRGSPSKRKGKGGEEEAHSSSRSGRSRSRAGKHSRSDRSSSRSSRHSRSKAGKSEQRERSEGSCSGDSSEEQPEKRRHRRHHHHHHRHHHRDRD